MRLRGLVFERYVTFERGEVDLCDEHGVPLDVVLFVGESGVGKSALLRGVAALLGEAVGAGLGFAPEDVLHGKEDGRCRVVFDDVAGDEHVVVTIEKELGKAPPGEPGLRGLPPAVFSKWQAGLAGDAAPRAAFSIATGDGEGGEEGEADEPTLFDWALELDGDARAAMVKAIDDVLAPWKLEPDPGEHGDLVFFGPAGRATSNDLGDGFRSVLVIALELARLSSGRPSDELVCVIDDIDAHLHPRWAARLLGDLRRAFPRVQLVASTHSPWLAASVEPSRVYVLERTGATTTIARASSRVVHGATSSHVMDLAFGLPDQGGLRWAHVPPLAIRTEMVRELEAELPRGAVVHVLTELIHVKEVKNAFGEAVMPTTDAVIGYLFFIDHRAGAPWGHSCEYVFRAGDGKVTRQPAIWPPPDLARFVPIGRT